MRTVSSQAEDARIYKDWQGDQQAHKHRYSEEAFKNISLSKGSFKALFC